MIKYTIYKEKDYILCMKQGDYIISFIDEVSEFEKVIQSVIDEGYTVTLNGNKLTLESESITFELKDAQALLYNPFLGRLWEDVSRVINEKGYTDNTIKTIRNNALKSLLQTGAVVASCICLTSLFAVGYANMAKADENIKVDEAVVETYVPTESYKESEEVHEELMKARALYNAPLPKEKEEPTYEEMCDEYMCKYAHIFHLDEEKVLAFAHMVTEDYTKDFTEVIGSSYYDVDSPEAACMVFVYNMQRNHLAQKLKEYTPLASFPEYEEGLVLSKEYFKTGEEVVTLGEDLTLDSGLSYSEYLGEVADLLGADKVYLLSISYLESGRVTSNLALNKNNFGGMRSNGEFFTFPTPEAGIIAFCYNLRTYERYNLTSLESLSGIYVNGDSSTVAENWVKNVRGFHSEITSNLDSYFLPEEVEVTLYSDDTLKRTLEK